MAKREINGLADVIAILISPVLIMAMVGALVFFLIEVFYGGEYSGRMRWTMFFFVFGSVLVARISIEMGDAKATLYAIVLGAASFVAMLRFVEFPPGWMEQFGPVVNVGLLVVVWWSARKLTWDCTYIDESKDASDRSLLEATGIENLERPEEWREEEPPAEEPEKPVEAGPVGWMRGYLRWRKKQDKKPHTPGVWVVYFSLAALPIFGLGQSLIPVEDEKSRSFSFYMMVVYVGSGLALLMTTAFLGLRQYLKQRKIEIPPAMAGIWLGLGSALILAFLVIAAILPRPASETPLVDVSSMTGSKDREASQYAQGGGDTGKGDGSAGDQSSKDAQSQQSQQGKSDEAGKGKGQDDARKGSGENKGKNGDSGKSDQKGNEKGGDKNGESKDGQKNPQKNNDQSKGKNEEQKGSSGRQTKSSGSSQPRKSSGKSSSGPMSISSLGTVGKIIKWVVFGILALIVGYFIFRHGLKFLANFMTWAKQLLEFLNNFWARLFGWQVKAPESTVVEDFDNVPKAGRPFAEFANPFENGEARRLSPDQLVKYSFAALEAWAWEHDKSRDPQETPLEFAHRLAGQYESLEKEAPRLATLYARLAYARGALPEQSRQHVAEFWRHLELASDEAAAARRPVEA
jgi:hypothetical protein